MQPPVKPDTLGSDPQPEKDLAMNDRPLVALGLLLTLLLLPALLVPAPAAAGDAAPLVAPTRLYTEPNLYLLLELRGERAHFRYSPGSLDRAANIQYRLEAFTRGFEHWFNHPLEIVTYVLTRDEWKQTGLPVAYGVPVRVGTHGIAVAAFGDAETIRLWSDQLSGVLPSISGFPLRGSPQEAASLAVADTFVQLLAGEIFVDDMGLGGDARWVRGLAAQLAALTVAQRLGTDRVEDLDALYRLISQRRPEKAFSARDLEGDLSLDEWLWFQSQLWNGARVLFAKEGKDAMKVLIKLRKKDGAVRAETLLRKHKPLEEWFRSSFAAVSMRTGG